MGRYLQESYDKALREIERLREERDALAARLERHSMDAGHAEQRRAESRAVREALGFGADADDVSPRDLLDALDRLKAEWQAEAMDSLADTLVKNKLANYYEVSITGMGLKGRAQQLRSQAEEEA